METNRQLATYIVEVVSFTHDNNLMLYFDTLDLDIIYWEHRKELFIHCLQNKYNTKQLIKLKHQIDTKNY